MSDVRYTQPVSSDVRAWTDCPREMGLHSLEAYWAEDSKECLSFSLRTGFTAEKSVWSGVRKWEKWENSKFDDDLELARWMWLALTCSISIVKSSTN